MKPAILCALALPLWCQSPEPPPKFEIAGIRTAAKAPNPFPRTMPVRAGRYEVKNASMVDLVRIAYGLLDASKVLGGPSWLEMDRFDILAKVPANSTPDDHKLMLKALLEDRFKLVAHNDTKPLPTYALTAGKKPLLKEATGKEEPGCRPEEGPSTPGGPRIITSGPTGSNVTINLGPNMAVQYHCRNMTMTTFAAELPRMFGTDVGPNPVIEDTGIKGAYNFDLHWSMRFLAMQAAPGERVSFTDAIEKQLGLKLEQRQVPTPVVVVDSVNRTPTPDPPGFAEALPQPVFPKEFDVASIKPSAPGAEGGRFQMQRGGGFTAENMSVRFLLTRAFNSNNREMITNMPKWADTDSYDIVAKTASDSPNAPALDMDSLAPLMRSLLADRFKLAYHTEDRPVSAYTLVASKPKLKKADPASRTFCKNAAAPAGSPPGSQILNCQNITMAQFADRLQNMSQELSWPVLDATELEGGWDFTLMFSRNINRGTEASDPTGAYTLFEAIEKQLGLKLEMHKRPMPVIVIDHIEQKPTEN